jgi:hypothetical protein
MASEDRDTVLKCKFRQIDIALIHANFFL